MYIILEIIILNKIRWFKNYYLVCGLFYVFVDNDGYVIYFFNIVWLENG